jgi:hypothetical protein
MATDGVKIIDGDTAHDTYWGIMDLYDNDADFELIKKEFPLIQNDYADNFDNEVYVTSCGLAYWELGILSTNDRQFINEVVDKGATIAEWTKENEKEGKARARELAKFLKKISKPNEKVKARKKYRKITNLYFQQGDILTFQLEDKKYRAVICTGVDQYRGVCNYLLTPTTYNAIQKPDFKCILNSEILGRQISTSSDETGIRLEQPGIGKIWDYVGHGNFFFGLMIMAVPHKDVMTFKDNFEKVGTLEIIESLKQVGTLSYECSFDRFENTFGDLDGHIEAFRLKRFPTKVIADLLE